MKLMFILTCFIFSAKCAAFPELYLEGDTGDLQHITSSSIQKSDERVCGFNIRSAARLDAIQVKYCSVGSTVITRTSEMIGGDGGYLSSFDLAPDEYITAINGFLGNKNDITRVFGLYIVTNKRATSIFGSSTNAPFYFQAPRDGAFSIQGIYLHAGTEVESFGVLIADDLRIN